MSQLAAGKTHIKWDSTIDLAMKKWRCASLREKKKKKKWEYSQGAIVSGYFFPY